MHKISPIDQQDYRANSDQHTYYSITDNRQPYQACRVNKLKRDLSTSAWIVGSGVAAILGSTCYMYNKCNNLDNDACQIFLSQIEILGTALLVTASGIYAYANHLANRAADTDKETESCDC